MGYIYNYKELVTKEDFIYQLKEIVAYRQLDGAPFDFGTGVMTSDFSLGSEDAYYEMDIWALEGAIEYFEDNHRPEKKKKKQRENKYARNRKHKNKLKELASSGGRWGDYPVYFNGRYYERYYRGKRSAYLKRQSSKKIRTHQGEFQKKGNKHKRVFDFFWELD